MILYCGDKENGYTRALSAMRLTVWMRSFDNKFNCLNFIKRYGPTIIFVDTYGDLLKLPSDCINNNKIAVFINADNFKDLDVADKLTTRYWFTTILREHWSSVFGSITATNDTMIYVDPACDTCVIPTDTSLKSQISCESWDADDPWATTLRSKLLMNQARLTNDLSENVLVNVILNYKQRLSQHSYGNAIMPAALCGRHIITDMADVKGKLGDSILYVNTLKECSDLIDKLVKGDEVPIDFSRTDYVARHFSYFNNLCSFFEAINGHTEASAARITGDRIATKYLWSVQNNAKDLVDV